MKKQNYFQQLFLIFLMTMLSFLAACASSTVRIETSPSEAQVELIYKNGSKKSLGKTPLFMPFEDLSVGEDSFVISLEKSGFEKDEIFIPGISKGRKIEMNVSLRQESNIGQAQVEKDLNTVAISTAEVQKYIQLKQYEMATVRLNKLIADFPKVSVFYSLMGNVNYLDKRFDGALTYYQKAYDLDPNSYEIKKMIEKLEGLKKGGAQ